MATRPADPTPILDKLLRGEISAAETYSQAIDKFSGRQEAPALQQFRDDQVEARNQLRRHVHDKGGQPETRSGTRGAFAKSVEGTAKAFGKTPALKALKEGEEQGVSDYESALQDRSLPPECRSLIENDLLPHCRQHIQGLDRLMAQQ
jgi:uncharacterized protein (TIGR02284 family)